MTEPSDRAVPTGPHFHTSEVAPSAPSAESTPQEITAFGALHFGWDAKTMRAVDRGLLTAGGFAFEPSERERAALRAWVTATDTRIGHVVYSTDADPAGFALVAREVTALDDNALLARYEERRREMRSERYQVRTVPQMSAEERARTVNGYLGAAKRYADDPESAQGAEYRGAAEAVRNGWGYVIWDRMTHMYEPAVWRSLPEEIAAECDRLNRRQAQRSRMSLWR